MTNRSDETTADKAARHGMTPDEYRAHRHLAAVRQIRTALPGLYATTGLRVEAALTEPAAVLRWAADHIEDHELLPTQDLKFVRGVDWALGRLRRMADESPLSPYYEHPECGFHWHGRDGMDIPMQDGQPVCPRCELAKVQKQLDYTQRRRDEVGAESLRRGKIKLEQAEKIARLERQLDEVRTQLGAEILRAGQAEAELRRMADETATTETCCWCGHPEDRHWTGATNMPFSDGCHDCRGWNGAHAYGQELPWLPEGDEPAAGARQDGSRP